MCVCMCVSVRVCARVRAHAYVSIVYYSGKKDSSVKCNKQLCIKESSNAMFVCQLISDVTLFKIQDYFIISSEMQLTGRKKPGTSFDT